MAAGESDEQLAERLANAAGAILLDLRASGLVGKRPGKAGDEAANAMLCREIRPARPADAQLSAEAQDHAAPWGDRTRAGSGKRVTRCVQLGGGAVSRKK